MSVMVNGNISKKVECAHCESCSFITDYDKGEIVCSDCGLVVSEKIEDQGKEWRSFLSDEHERNRVGPPMRPVFSHMILPTIIGNEKRDFSGKPFSFGTKWAIYRLRVLDNRSKKRRTSERNLYEVFFELGKLKDKLGVSDSIIEKSAYLYRKAATKRLTRGRNTQSVTGACLYVACRENNIPRTISDIADAVNAKRTDVSACVRLLIEEFNLTLPIVDYAQCVVRIANTIGVSERVKRYAIDILREAEQINITAGKDPMGLAAAALYLAAMKMNEHYYQSSIARIAKITGVTMRNRKIDLMNKLHLN